MSYKIRYKLTDQNMQTYNGYPWKRGKWQEPIGDSSYLCNPGWLHSYSHPLIAVLLNPIHANIKNPRLFKCLVKGKHLNDRGLKEGWKHMRLIEEIPVPKVSITQHVAFGILCTLKVYKEKTFVKWAEDWLSGKDRSEESANLAIRAGRAARAAIADFAARAAALAALAADAECAARAADADFAAIYALYALSAQAAECAAQAAQAARATLAGEKINLLNIAKQAMKVK